MDVVVKDVFVAVTDDEEEEALEDARNGNR